MRVVKDILIPFFVAAFLMLAVAVVIGWSARADAALTEGE